MTFIMEERLILSKAFSLSIEMTVTFIDLHVLYHQVDKVNLIMVSELCNVIVSVLLRIFVPFFHQKDYSVIFPIL